MNPEAAKLTEEIKEEVLKMDEEQQKAFFHSLMERFASRRKASDAENRAKRRSPMHVVRKKRRAKNKAAAKARVKNRK